jgi:hypothetical protein
MLYEMHCFIYSLHPEIQGIQTFKICPKLQEILLGELTRQLGNIHMHTYDYFYYKPKYGKPEGLHVSFCLPHHPRISRIPYIP